MSAANRRKATIVFSAIALIGGPGALAAEEIRRDYHETFDVRPGMKLALRHGDGDVTVTPWEQDSLDVDVRYRATASSVGWVKSTQFEVEFRQSADTIEVIGREPKRVSVGISTYRETEYTYRVKAPSYLLLELAGDDGDVEIESWRGAIEMRLEDGDVKLADIDAPRTEVTLEDGDLEIEGIRGELVVESEDGDVEIYDCSGEGGRIRLEDGDLTINRCDGSVEISTSDGDIRLTGFAAAGLRIRSGDGTVDLGLVPTGALDLDVRVGDGDVRVDLAEGVSAAFELETRDGRIRVDASEVQNLVKERHRVTGQIGDAAGKIYIRTSDGSVTLRQ